MDASASSPLGRAIAPIMDRRTDQLRGRYRGLGGFKPATIVLDEVGGMPTGLKTA